jgi:hypothetical protein
MAIKARVPAGTEAAAAVADGRHEALLARLTAAGPEGSGSLRCGGSPAACFFDGSVAAKRATVATVW